MEKTPLALVATFPKDKIQDPPWSSEACLEEFLGDVKDGTVKPANVMIFYLQEEEDGRLRPHAWVQNVSLTERIAYGQLIVHMAMEEWRT